MKLLAYVRSLAAKFLHRSEIEDDLEEELRSHIQHRADDLEHSGLGRAEAELRARIEFGGMSVSKRSHAKRWAAILSRLSSRICASRCARCASLPDSPSWQY